MDTPEDRFTARRSPDARERDLWRFVDDLPMHFIFLAPDGEIENVNRATLTYYGKTLEELRGWTQASALHPDDHDWVVDAWSKAIAARSRDVFEITHRARRHDGVYRWMHARMFPFWDENGELVRWMCLNIDIDDLKHAESEVRTANRELLEAQNLSHVGSYTADLATDKYTASAELRNIWEFDSDEEVSIAELLRRIHPDDRARFEAEFASVFTGSSSDIAFRIVTPSGKIRHLHSVSRVLKYNEGGPVVVGIQQDETERVLAAEALKASEADLRRANAELINAQGHITAAQRLSQTGSFIWDVTADEHHWSDELYRIAEVDPGVTINMERVRECIHPEDRPALEAAIEQAMDGSGFDYSGRIVTPTGGVKHFHIVGQRIELITDRLVFVGALRDITESKVAEDALNKARADLAHASRVMALSALTASIAHEVNQPLAGIVANAATCSRMLAADPPNVAGAQATAQRMIRDGDRAADVIQRLRALFSNRPPELEAVKLNEAAAEVLALASTELQAAGVTLRTDFERGLPPVRGDRVQLQQVVLNLVLNAAEAMAAVEGRPRELTVASVRDGEERVRLWVRDVGVGVAPDRVENLFEAFHTTKEKGMGVGLAVSRSIIESHQGRLWAEPNEGAGATFTFTIPVQAEAETRPRS